MRRRSLFVLHLAAIVVLAAGVSVGVLGNAHRDRIATLAELRVRLAGATVCNVSATPGAWGPCLGAPPSGTAQVRTIIRDPAVLTRLLAALPAVEVFPNKLGLNFGTPPIVLDFPAEGVTLWAWPHFVLLRFNDQHYDYCSRHTDYDRADGRLGAFVRFAEGLAVGEADADQCQPMMPCDPMAPRQPSK